MKIGYLFVFFITFSSCKDGTDQKVKKMEVIVNLDTRKVSSDVIFGKWIIDSIAEDRVITNVSKNSDTSYEGFNFDHKNRIQMVRRTAKVEESKPFCDFELKGDSLFFIRSGRIFQRYGVQKLGKNAIALHGNYFITEHFRKKPSFYLTRKW